MVPLLSRSESSRESGSSCSSISVSVSVSGSVSGSGSSVSSASVGGSVNAREVTRLEATDSAPDLESRRYLRSSAVCFRSCLSSVRLMASREAFVISRSWTLRSRRALATSSLRETSKRDFVGLCASGGNAPPSRSSASSRRSSATCSIDAIVMAGWGNPGLNGGDCGAVSDCGGGMENRAMAKGSAATVLAVLLRLPPASLDAGSTLPLR